MNVQLRVSDSWLEGFAKTAEAAGLAPEQVPHLLKVAYILQTRAMDPEAFDAGLDEVFDAAEKQAAGGAALARGAAKAVSRGAAKAAPAAAKAAPAVAAAAKPRRWPLALSALLGGMGFLGARDLVRLGSNYIAEQNMLDNMNKYRMLYGRNQSIQAMINSLPGMRQSAGFAGGPGAMGFYPF